MSTRTAFEMGRNWETSTRSAYGCCDSEAMATLPALSLGGATLGVGGGVGVDGGWGVVEGIGGAVDVGAAVVGAAVVGAAVVGAAVVGAAGVGGLACC